MHSKCLTCTGMYVLMCLRDVVESCLAAEFGQHEQEVVSQRRTRLRSHKYVAKLLVHFLFAGDSAVELHKYVLKF